MPLRSLQLTPGEFPGHAQWGKPKQSPGSSELRTQSWGEGAWEAKWPECTRPSPREECSTERMPVGKRV